MAIGANDHPHIKEIKKQINKIVDQEVTRLDFGSKVDQEALVDNTYKQVLSKKSFYFGVDGNKAITNSKVYNVKAPGNPHHKPNVILPHEHVDVNNYINTDGLSEDKLFEIYGYYSAMIDMHIA